jgi:inositol oxygenase
MFRQLPGCDVMELQQETCMQGPLQSLDQWDDFVKGRYNPSRTKDEFRQHTEEAPTVVQEFYRQNHIHQTRDFVLQKKKEYGALNKQTMSIWEAMEYLNTLIDDSDPDTDLSQIHHLLQTAEAMRKDGRPRWFILAGLLHDIGKVLCLYGEPQWAVVGDTFPVGCAWSDQIVYPQYFDGNPDRNVPEYQTRLGVYTERCGMDKVDISWGHDEYMYMIAKQYMPWQALYMIRYHSFYPWHQEGGYHHFMNDQDREGLKWVKEFSPYDLYSKSDEKPDLEKVRPYYDGLIAEFFPQEVRW